MIREMFGWVKGMELEVVYAGSGLAGDRGELEGCGSVQLLGMETTPEGAQNGALTF